MRRIVFVFFFLSFNFATSGLQASLTEKARKAVAENFWKNPVDFTNKTLQVIDFVNNNLEKLPHPDEVPLHSDALHSFLSDKIEFLGPVAGAWAMKGKVDTLGSDFASFYRYGDAKASTKFGLQSITVGYGAAVLLFPAALPIGAVGIGLGVGVTAARLAHSFIDSKDAVTVAAYFGAKHLNYRANYTLNQWNEKKQLGSRSKEKGYHSNAYLGCEYYDDDGYVYDDWWIWINRDNMSHLVPPQKDGSTKHQKLSYYGKTMQLKGRWISVPSKNEDIWVFGTTEDPMTLAGLCLEIVKNKIIETRERVDNFNPKNVKVAVGDYNKKHEIIYYARDKELSALKGKIYYSQVNFGG